MSAAANAAGFLYLSGRIRGAQARDVNRAELEQQLRQREAERAAVGLKREREAKEKKQTTRRSP